jgi:phage-related protein (TIGR01555 family)
MLNRLLSLFAQDTAPAPAPATTMNTDGAMNAINGMGMVGRDSSVSTFFAHDPLMQRQQVEAQFNSSGVARRLVSLIVDDSLSKGIECDIQLYKELERIDAFNKMTELATVARLYGGAIMVMLAKDGSDTLDKPMNEGTLDQIDKLVIFDRWQCTEMDTDYNDDITSPMYGEREYYTVTPYNGTPFRVHHTRVMRLDGDYLPHETKRLNSGWGASALQAVQAGFKSYSTMQNFLPLMASEFGLTIFKIQGLADAYLAGNESKVSKRGNDINVSKSMANMVLLDGEFEDFNRQFATVNGYADLVTKGMELLSAEAGIPMTLLFGRSPEGMNATGESDLDNWYKKVQSYQTNVLQRPMNRLIELLTLQRAWRDKPESLDWEWPSLQPLDDLELADVRLKHAQADRMYIDAQAVDPDYLFHARHDGGFNTQLNYSEKEMDDYMKGRESAIMERDLEEEGDLGSEET